jgi:hypothetical protein
LLIEWDESSAKAFSGHYRRWASYLWKPEDVRVIGAVDALARVSEDK